MVCSVRKFKEVDFFPLGKVKGSKAPDKDPGRDPGLDSGGYSQGLD